MANYNIRNVAEKEIYDSYMGIMRISPNLSNPLNENSKLIDDPTAILNSLISINPLTKDQSQTEVILSDSDGNILPITFIPKAKRTTVVIERVEKTIPLINIVTKINDEAKLYIEENFKSYSTIWIDNNEENDVNDAPSKISSLQIHTKSGIKENVLLYPIESPNDSSYFNNKNRLNLVDVQSSEYKPSQLKNELHKKDYVWYTSNFKEKPEKPIADENYAVDNYVSIDGKYVTTYNEKGELVPVLYTKDYVLGHYDGHSVNLNANNTPGVKSNWIGSNSRLFDNPSLSGATKLSWMRIDNLVWDIIDSVLKGDLRHVKGRYQGLGAEENDDIMAALFEGGNCTLHDDPNGSDWLQKTAPMLGQGVQPGLILYNAMPFARYMFHVARQMCTNLMYQFGEENGEVKSSWKIDGENKFNLVSEAIRIAKANKLITPAPKAALSSVHSLVKDFLLCDGKEINYFNYPNINIANKNLFVIDSNKFYPVPDAKNHTFNEIGVAATESKLYKAMYKSRNNVFDTPHLYVLTEDAPRFIRGLNWSLDSSDFDKYKGQEEVVSFNNVSNNYGKISAENTNTVNVSLTDEDIEKYGDLRVTQGEFKYTANAIKNIKEVGLYFQNYDFKVKRGEHYHAEFSGESGMNSARDASTPYEEVNKTECVGYHAGEKRGATGYFANHENVLNHDKTNTCYDINDYSPNWINYCFESHNKYDGYAPIPNGGLYLFNRRLYNDKDISKFYYGTTIDIENKINNGQFVYYDGENNVHRFEKITAETTIHNNFVDKIKENLDKNNISYTANELEKYKYKSNDTQATRRKNHEDFITFLSNKGYINKLTSAVVAQCYEETFGEHYNEKERRRIMLTKINESEGRIPASARGGPYYRIGVVWSREERRGIRKKRRKAYSYYWTNVGIYKISTNIEINNSAYKSEYSYRCLTGLPYSNRKKLGVGNLSTSIESDWYSKNSVTTPINEISHKQISYGGEKIQSDVMQNGLPTPDYLNLLPLIRI